VIKVVLGGPPRSGKSVLRQGLKDAIISQSGNAIYPLVITACPDGEGAWFQEAAANNSELAAECKQRYKGKFTPEFVEMRAEQVQKCVMLISIIDIGGLVDPFNETICASATHAVLLSRTEEQFLEWEVFCGKLKLEVIGKLISDYHATEDLVHHTEVGLRGRVHHLERGEDVSARPAIVALAELLLRVCGAKK